MMTGTRSTVQPALIVVDLTRDYFDPGLWPDSELPAQKSVLTRATNELTRIVRNHNVPVIWFRQEFQPDLSDAFLHVRDSNRRYAIAGTPGSKLLDELDVDSGDTVLTKTRYSAFFGTVLDQMLERIGANLLILAGITSAWCIRATATDAYQRDYRVVFAQECLSAFTREAHQRAVEEMRAVLGPFWSNREIEIRLTFDRWEAGG
jgi:nicotinamidase-related amidase